MNQVLKMWSYSLQFHMDYFWSVHLDYGKTLPYNVQHINTIISSNLIKYLLLNECLWHNMKFSNNQNYDIHTNYFYLSEINHLSV